MQVKNKQHFKKLKNCIKWLKIKNIKKFQNFLEYIINDNFVSIFLKYIHLTVFAFYKEFENLFTSF